MEQTGYFSFLGLAFFADTPYERVVKLHCCMPRLSGAVAASFFDNLG